MKVKKHSLLGEISAIVNGDLPTVTVPLVGHTFKVGILKPEGDDWVNVNTSGNNIVSVLTNTKRPTVAACLIAIDDTPIEQLFSPDETMTVTEMEYLKGNPTEMRSWRRRAVLEWLSEESSSFIVNELYEKYNELQRNHTESLRKIGNLSVRTDLNS